MEANGNKKENVNIGTFQALLRFVLKHLLVYGFSLYS